MEHFAVVAALLIGVVGFMRADVALVAAATLLGCVASLRLNVS